MEEKQVRRQINLPLKRAVEISVRSLSIRLGRSLVTSAVVFLAIAFLAYMMTVQDISRKKLDYDSKAEKITAMAQLEAAHAETQRVWVTILSLMVAVIGIANTLHMSVAERYREIGTMKCLGALNRFVVELFLLEALAMGVIGSGLGSFLGVILALLLKGSDYAGVSLAWSQLGRNFLVALGVGVLLTLVGAMYPAYRASRMHPAEAMRTEV